MSEQLFSALARLRTNTNEVVGAGVLVGDNNILTCAHVVNQALGRSNDAAESPTERVRVDFPAFEHAGPVSAAVHFWSPIRRDGRGDIAGLVLDDDPPRGARPVALHTPSEVWGHAFRSFGFPESAPNGTWARGMLLAGEGTGWLQLVARAGRPLERGFSGAPVWDEELQGVVGMVVATDEPPSRDRVAFAIPSRILQDAWHVALKPRSCPYVGLAAFGPEQSLVFFGREDFADMLADRVGRRPLCAVLGPSGSGKSSVVAAGLAPVLSPREWSVVHMRPGQAPFWELASCLLPGDPAQGMPARMADVDMVRARLRDGRLDEVLSARRASDPRDRVLVIIDQFEEVFTQCEDVSERDEFLGELARIPQRYRAGRMPLLTVLLTMRSDFYDHAIGNSAFAEALNAEEAVVGLGPMKERLRVAIEQPARTRGISFEPGLVDRILADLGEDASQLPLLQEMLRLLWDRQVGRQLTHSAYHELGGVDNALAQHAGQVYAELSPAEQVRARGVLTRLVTTHGDAITDTRKIAYGSDFSEADWQLVQRLADKRLVITGTDHARQQTVMLAHEALIRSWDDLGRWLKEDSERRLLAGRIQDRMRTWKDLNRANSELLRGEFLAQAVSWRAGQPTEITRETASYMDASQALQVKELVRRGMFPAQRGRPLYQQAEEIAGQIEDPTLKLTSQASIWNVWRDFELPERPFVSAGYWLKIWKHRRQLAQADVKIKLFDGSALGLLIELLIIAFAWSIAALWAISYVVTNLSPGRYLLAGALIIADLIAAAWIVGRRRSWLGAGLALPFMLLTISIALAAPFDIGFRHGLYVSIGAAVCLALALHYWRRRQRLTSLASRFRVSRRCV